MKSITAELPGDHLAVDLVADIPKARDGEDNLLVIVDIMTKFAFLRALKGKAMHTIACAFWGVVSIFGVPKVMQSKNGP